MFCGSSDGRDAAHGRAAEEFGALLARRGLGLVYGGGRVGLMGRVADAALAGGGEVLGVIPRALATAEVAHDGVTRLFVVHTMHERKAKMASLADAFVALPGGYGTLEELLEIVTWVQLSVLSAPVGLFDVAGYFEPLVAQLDRAHAEGYVSAEHRTILIVERDAERLLDRLAAHEAPAAAHARALRWT